MASSSSSVVPRRKGGSTYDVFLSFRGEDTRNNFVDHLYEALTLKGIHTFKDDKMLGGGQPISEELVKAIEESRWAVVVFSKSYANSSWCLEELSMIMECHKQMGGQKKVLPVFYHVDPSNVRKQNGDFAAAFKTHEDKFKGEMDKVNNWRDALTAAANLSGQHIDYGGEVAFISKIVVEILADIQPRGGSRENHLIGIAPRIDALISLLKMEATEEVRIVGICGMGGIGKTTIAQALFNRIAYKFKGSSFVADVRENSSSKKDMCALQERILNDVLGERHGYKIKDRDQGAKIIQERCCRKKVLLVLDDVNDVEQLEFLAATREWFGAGSRIIITSRDEHLLSYADDKYKPAILSGDQAVELFSRNAFNQRSPPEGYEELSIRAMHHAGGLPLALKVLGSFFKERKANVWESALKRLAKTQNDKIFNTLKLSFDDLGVSEKQIFLDIACFYKGKRVDDVTRILDSFGFDPVIGISVLVEKSLITISSYNTVDMHDLIQEMGRKVVQESAPISRVWQHEKIHDLINKKELEFIEGLAESGDYDVDLKQSANVFKSMKNLRVLHCDGKFTCRKPRFLPDELRWFCWRKYPFSSLPLAHMSKLVGIEMENAKIKHLWKGKKVYNTWKPLSYLAPAVSLYKNSSLKLINLSRCKSLKRFPDVLGAPNIESLDLGFCENMVEVDESVGSLKKLIRLSMNGCSKLKHLPSMLHMESLKTLYLDRCWSLKRISEFSPCMVNLCILSINWCSKIEEVPSSIKYLSNLTYLNLNGCSSLKNIPNSICELKFLKTLHLNNFQSMGSLEKKALIWELKFASTFRLSSCNILQELPHPFLEVLIIDSIHIHAFTNISYLRKLYLDGDLGDNNFPKILHGLSFLEELHIILNDKLIKLPETISHLSTLKLLEIWRCVRLQTLGGLPPGIQVLTVEHCNSLEKIEDLSKEYKCLNKIDISNCRKLLEDEENGRYLEKMLDQSFHKKWAAVDGCLAICIPGSKIPSWFKEQQDGCKIALKLPPKWQTEIIGFAMCCVSRTWEEYPDINLRFENDEMFVSKSETNKINDTEEADLKLWTSYIPYSLFEQLHGGNDNDVEGEDWFHMTEDNLVFEISGYYSRDVVRCGAKVVYKEDVASIQQTIPSISSFYWSWKLTKDEFTNSFKCRDSRVEFES